MSRRSPSFFLGLKARREQRRGDNALVRELGVNALELCLALRAGKRLGFVVFAQRRRDTRRTQRAWGGLLAAGELLAFF